MILVTGSRGFLGSHFNKLFKDNKVVNIIRSETFSYKGDVIELDITNKTHFTELEKLSEINPETIIHLAGRIDISFNIDDKLNLLPNNKAIADIYMSNIISTTNIVEYSIRKGVKHLIFASSQTVYGMPTESVLNEDSLCNPLEHYALSKYCSEQILSLSTKQGLNVTILRFPGLYGEKRKSGLVYSLCKSAIENKKITIDLNFPLPLDVLHIEDAANGINEAVRMKGNGLKIFNIASGEPCNINILANKIANLVPNCNIVYSEVLQPIVCLDASRAFQELGWKALPIEGRLSSLIRSI